MIIANARPELLPEQKKVFSGSERTKQATGEDRNKCAASDA